ncbi:MAG: Tricarboxylate transport protein TctC [Betaproteobacteria bacterium]|jgi:tripartite-type tricarboxylate transporter receptor subunit TctC|nr:Tricarboxylate transport protein TctC [Betaproteobacteria bacterium]
MRRKPIAMIACRLVSAAALTFAYSAAAADYPNRPIRMIVAFAPGGGTDITGRIAAKAIGDNLGAQVVVDNRPGAGGNIGTEIVAKSIPDGYTLVTAGTGTHAINPWLYPKIPYDAVKDFDPVCLVAASPYLMVVNLSVPAKTVKELIALAKATPDTINMASSGSGGMPHLSGELFNMMTGIKMVHVPYKGTGAVFPDLIGGRVQVTFGDIVATVPHVKAEKLRALGITSPNRVWSLSDIPTIAESGVPGYDAVGWFGVFAPAGTPKTVITRLNAAIVNYVKQPDVAQRLAALGAEVVASTPEQFRVVQNADLARWGKVVKQSGARVE